MAFLQTRPMIEQRITIENRLGLHARAAAKLVSTASRFASEVMLSHNGRTVNAKSIMGVMMLAASRGSELEVRVEGPDEAASWNALAELIGDKFGEGE